MRKPKHFVFDTNTLVSALLLPASVPRRAFDKAVGAGCLLLCSTTIVELDDVLRRPKLDRYLIEEERLAFLVALVHEAHLVRPSVTVTDCRDPRDPRLGQGGIGCGFDRGGVGEEPFGRIPTECKPCEMESDGTLKYGGAAPKACRCVKSNGDVWDCINNNPAKKPYGSWHFSWDLEYNCIDWAEEAVNNCCLKCGSWQSHL